MREMQKEMKDIIIPDEIGLICFGFYYIKSDRFVVNDDTIFEFDRDKYADGYHILGQMKVDRELMDEYEWKIETTASYLGRFGIIDDTNNASSKLKDGRWIWQNPDVISVATENGFWSGSYFGTSNLRELGKFIGHKGDIVTIHVNYKENNVTFQSQNANKKAVKKLKEGMDVIRFVAEFRGNTTMKILDNE